MNDFKKYLRPGRGATDVLPIFFDGEVFHQLIDHLVDLFSDISIDKVACIEGKGFILGSAVAYKLNCGLAPIRNTEKIRNDQYTFTITDYSGNEKTFGILKDSVEEGERILVIDDWVETGNTTKAAIHLIESCKGTVVGIGALMDDTKEEIKDFLSKYNYKYLEQVSDKDNF